jgi:hypothetical protein
MYFFSGFMTVFAFASLSAWIVQLDTWRIHVKAVIDDYLIWLETP